MKYILLFSFALIVAACSRKSQPPAPPQVVRCDTSYVSPYTYKCGEVTDPGIKEGFCEEYISNFKSAEGSFKNDKQDGVWKFWFPDSRYRMEGTYSNGSRQGNWNYYTNDTLLYTLVFNADTISDSIQVAKYIPKVKPDGTVEAQQRMAVFAAGDMMSYIRGKICYPPDCMDLAIQGTVWVEFAVNKTGGVQDIKIIKSPPGMCGLEREVIRVVRNLPRFYPGMQNFRPVKIKLTVPVKFRLN